MKRECRSCGNIIDDGLLYCPACGTKVESVNKTTCNPINKELEQWLYTVNANAEIALSKKLGPGSAGAKNYENLNKIEIAYMEIIQKFPTESKPYIAYVDYMIKYIVKINSLTGIFVATQYFIGDIDLIITRCKNYLLRAKDFADENNLEMILQLESVLSSKIEVIENDDTIKQKEEKNKKISKWFWIWSCIFMGVGFIVWLMDVIGV